MLIHITIIGWILVALALVHVIFPNYFNWDEDLKNCSLINKQIMSVHTFFIAVTVFLIGVLCITSAELLLETELGKRVLLGLGIFWGLRLYAQFFMYSSDLWKGKKFETVVHIVFSILWFYVTTVFIISYFQK